MARYHAFDKVEQRSEGVHPPGAGQRVGRVRRAALFAAVSLASALLTGCAEDGAALRAPGGRPLDAPPGGALDEATGATAISPMPEPRRAHTAVLLPTGRVLVFGGTSETIIGLAPFDFEHEISLVTSAVLYEPATGTWTPAAPAPRSARPSTPPVVLQDGRVMVLFGSTVDMYDPTLDTWAPAAAMPTDRNGYAATKLPDGRVLVVGGRSTTAPFTPTSAAEIYDPATDTWADATPMGATSTSNVGAVTLLDGRVLVVGGFDHAELYDPASSTWARSLPRNHTVGRAVLLSSGKVLTAAAGGQSEVYDPATNAWTSVQGLDTSATFSSQALTPLRDGRALLTGGRWSRDNFHDEDGLPACGGAIPCVQIHGFTDAAWLFDPATQSWAAAPPMTLARAQHSTTLLPDGAVLIAGGDVSDSSGTTYVTTDAAELYGTQNGVGGGGGHGGGHGGAGGGAGGSNGTGGAGGSDGTGGAGGSNGGAGGSDGGAGGGAGGSDGTGGAGGSDGGAGGGAGGSDGTGGAGGSDGTGGAGGSNGTGGADGSDGTGSAGGSDGGPGGSDGTGGAGGSDGTGGAGESAASGTGSASQGSSGDPGPGASGPGGSSGGHGCSAGGIGATASAANGYGTGGAAGVRRSWLGALTLLGVLGLRRRRAPGR
ncbi:kelch repeat-containing protein [Sorangium sp. So ce1036]|uniref:Kelch repeat-containing protein n=1 Tax=Sorangium sp. So ce1036 TaxID=3133328 RepID=UPI003F057CBB